MENKIADELEGQTLDFKQWKDSIEDSIKLIINRGIISLCEENTTASGRIARPYSACLPFIRV